MKTLQLTQEALEDARLPKAFWPLGSDTYFGNRLALKQSEHYIRKHAEALASGTGLLLIGPPSSLKTFLLTYILRCLLAKGHSVRYTTLDELVDLYFQREGASIGSELCTDRFVAVDNLSEVINKAAPNALKALFRRRRDNGLCTLFATDLEDAEFTRQYGPVAESVEESSLKIHCSSKSFQLAERRDRRLSQLSLHEEGVHAN